MSKEIKGYGKEIHREDDAIEMPIYFWEDEKTKEKHYDFEEMANVLEDRICKYLNCNVLITMSEVEEEDNG